MLYDARGAVCGPVSKCLINLLRSVPNVLLLEAHAGAGCILVLSIHKPLGNHKKHPESIRKYQQASRSQQSRCMLVPQSGNFGAKFCRGVWGLVLLAGHCPTAQPLLLVGQSENKICNQVVPQKP